MTAEIAFLSNTTDDNDGLFAGIAQDLVEQGYSIQVGQLPLSVLDPITEYCHSLHSVKFVPAGIGRTLTFQQNRFVRRDEICWITGESTAGQIWLDWTARLQQYLNQRLFLGLFSFESHFAHYPPGAFYKRHTDAFIGEANRVLSVVVYLNPDWQHDAGGELVLYQDEDDNEGIKVTPLLGTIVVFLSETFPHEVLPAKTDRYSIAGWYRLNQSRPHRVDPSR